jgi:hypothetical protein
LNAPLTLGFRYYILRAMAALRPVLATPAFLRGLNVSSRDFVYFTPQFLDTLGYRLWHVTD